MRRKPTTGLWLLFCAALSSGCARSEPPLELLRPEIPAALLSCPMRPDAPAADGTQRSAALYVIALAEAHGVCRDRLSAVARLVGPEAAR